MPSDAFHAFYSPGIQPAQARLILLLVLSLALHLALVFLVPVKPVKPAIRPGTWVKVLQVALAGQTHAANRQAGEALSSLPAQKPDVTAVPELVPAASPPDAPPDQPAAPSPPPAQAELAPPLLPALEMPLVDDPIYYTARQVDAHPSALEPVTPEFPDTALRAGVEGFVTLRLLIDDAGVVREVSVIEAQPPDTFEAVALSAFRNARFAPAQRNGRPVKSEVLIKVMFELVSRNKRGPKFGD